MQEKNTRVKLMQKGILILLSLLFIIDFSYGQEGQEEKKNDSENKISLNLSDIGKWADTAQSGQQVSPLEFKLTGNSQLDSAIIQAQIDHKVFAVKHFQRTFTQQYYSGIFIFMMVIAIVATGLLLSYKQFKLNEEIVRHGIQTNKDVIDKGQDTNSSITINKDGLTFNSAVIGLMLLIISLLFFFLYLKFVYQIEVLNM